MTKYPRVKQKLSRDCGVACVKCILKYYKYKIKYQIIFRRLEPTVAGVKEQKIVDFLNGIDGFHSEYYENVDVDTLKKILDVNPAIALIQSYNEYVDQYFGHYVVLTYYNNEKITFMDPEIGKLRKLEWDEFIKNWYTETDDDKIVSHQVITVEQIKNL